MTAPVHARLCSAGVTLALAGAALLISPAPAQAVVLSSAQSVADTDVDFSTVPPVCHYTGTPVPVGVPAPFAADGVPVTQTSSYSGTVVNNSLPSDTTAVSASVTHEVSATQANGTLSTVSVDDSFQVTTNPALGTAQACQAEADADEDTSFQFDLPSPKWALVEIESEQTQGQVDLDTMTLVDPGVSETFFVSPHYHRTERVYLPAGHYDFEIQASLGSDAPFPGGGTASRTGHLSLTLGFADPGTATTAAASAGHGGKYVDLAPARDCAAGTLSATWKSKAGKGKHARVKKATFYVNDAKVKTVRRPKKKSVTTLTGLVPDQPADVRVSLRLAKRGAGTVTVERSYLSCT